MNNCFCLSGLSGQRDVTVTTVVTILFTTIAILAVAIIGEFSYMYRGGSRIYQRGILS